jgi:trehalose 6-phosphate phosphatase
LRPPLDWNKGHAVGYLLKNLGLDNPETFSIYIGDDTTDEDAFQVTIASGTCAQLNIASLICCIFQVLREQCKGIGILVAERSKPTAASYSVKNPNEVNFISVLALQ